MSDIKKEAVNIVSVSNLKNFSDNPFLVRENESMEELVSSIKLNGVITPITVMPSEDGKYEIISGHRRKRACELAGINKVPVVIKHITRDEAIIMMVDSNIQREEILPSEKAHAYAMKYEALKRKEGRPFLSDTENHQQIKTRDLIALGSPDSERTIQRYIKLGSLIPDLMEMVDNKKIGITPATELAFLTPDEQKIVFSSIETEGSPSLSQAQRIRKLSLDNMISQDSVFDILSEQKKKDSFNIVIPMSKFKKYFPRAVSPKEIEEKLLSICERLYQQQIRKSKDESR